MRQTNEGNQRGCSGQKKCNLSSNQIYELLDREYFEVEEKIRSFITDYEDSDILSDRADCQTDNQAAEAHAVRGNDELKNGS